MTQIVVPSDSAIYANLLDVAQSCDVAFVVGISATGKSLFVQQLALMAQREGRSVHLLQWDVTQRAFEIDDLLERYPDTKDGETPPFIRRAVGTWVRPAIHRWYEEFGRSKHMLIGEAPLIGGRLAELSRPLGDEAESILGGTTSRFILPVASTRVRDVITGKRVETSSAPQHARENFDAPPTMLELQWQEVTQIGRDLGLITPSDKHSSYDPDSYQSIFEHILQHRTTTTLHIDSALPHVGSVYDLEKIISEVSATPQEVRQAVSYLENTFTAEQIDLVVNYWYQTTDHM